MLSGTSDGHRVSKAQESARHRLHVRSFAPRPQAFIAQQRHSNGVVFRPGRVSVAPEPGDVAASGGGVEQLRAQTRRRDVLWDAAADVGGAYSAQRGQRKPVRERLLKRHEPASTPAGCAERGAGLSCADEVVTRDAMQHLTLKRRGR